MKKFDILGEIHQCDSFLIARHEKNHCPDYPRKSQGEIAVDVPSAEIFMDSWQKGIFSGYRIGSDPFRKKLDELLKISGPVHIDLIRCISDYQRLKIAESGMTYEEFARDYYRRLFDFAMEHPDRAMLCVLAEYDSSCPWPKDRAFATRKEGHDYFWNCAFHKKIGSGDSEMLFKCFQEYGKSYRDLNFMAHGACLFALHYYFEAGFPHIELERGIGASCNMQISMGYLRGAWKQFGRKARWGVDYSTHNCHYNRLNHYREDGARIGGRTESLCLRSWLLSYLAGADYLLCEGSDFTHYIHHADGSFELSRLGKWAKKFADYTLRPEADRGTPVVPAAVMLDYYNGYENRGYPLERPVVWGNRYPFSIEDAHITCIYESFYPGHGEANDDGDIAAHPEFPGRTRKEILDYQLAGGDMRPFEKGYLVPAPYGDCLDVLLDNAPSATIAEYPVLILAGTAAPEAQTLVDYVKNGGTLCAAFNQLPEKFLEALAVRHRPGFSDDWDIDTITFLPENTRHPGFRYGFARFDFPTGTRTIAVNEKNIPLIVSVPFGKGKALICTAFFGMECSARILLPAWSRTLGLVAAEHFPLKASAPGLELAVNRTSDGLLAGVFNNRAEAWRGTLTPDDGTPCELSLEPFEAAVVRWSGTSLPRMEYQINC